MSTIFCTAIDCSAPSCVIDGLKGRRFRGKSRKDRLGNDASVAFAARTRLSLAPALGSTSSSAGRPTSFVRFTVTHGEVLTPRPRASSASARRLPDADRSTHARPRSRSPGFGSRSVRPCLGLRPRRTGYALALTRTPFLPSAVTTARASRLILSRLNGWPMRTPGRPRGRRRTARGRCGSLFLHRSGLAQPTPRRPPGALSPQFHV